MATSDNRGRSLFSIPLSCFLIFFCALFGQEVRSQLNYIYQNGEEGYRCFRIPAIIATPGGILLAFAEGRKKSCRDTDDIDLVLKRSLDGGTTWSKMSVVWDDGNNTCGNPAPVVDKKTGRVILLSTWNKGSDTESMIIDGTSVDTRRIYTLTSDDEGQHWSIPKEITSEVKRPEWTWYATGPVNGIQLESKVYKGRLMIPCDHIEAGTKKYYSHVIYSDDGGLNWKLGGSTPTDGVNESTVAELPGGDLLLNMRNYKGERLRKVSRSLDGGSTWTHPVSDPNLPEPVCQASMIAFVDKRGKPMLAFSNPADDHTRVRMTVRLSRNKGRTWPLSLVLHQGPSAYSNLVLMPNGNLGCLFEGGKDSPYEGIAFRTFLLKDLR